MCNKYEFLVVECRISKTLFIIRIFIYFYVDLSKIDIFFYIYILFRIRVNIII